MRSWESSCFALHLFNMSAASMIRRFREGKPTSRLEREAARDLDRKAGSKEMWWVDRDNTGTDEFEEPRLPPKAAVKPPRVSHNEILERLRQPNDNMSITAAKKFSSDRSLNVDQMIEMEIRGWSSVWNVVLNYLN